MPKNKNKKRSKAAQNNDYTVNHYSKIQKIIVFSIALGLIGGAALAAASSSAPSPQNTTGSPDMVVKEANG